ncbi:MAG: class I SAM-dependent methyltransferase, partial [Anaerolineales bacterium]
LQKAMRQQPGFVTGIDESRQMAGIARRRLEGLGDARCALVRGRAQSLPYCRQAFDTVVATFPTEFIVDLDALREVHRVLGASGKLVVLAAAWIRGTTLLERAAAWLFKSTHQSPASLPASAAAEFVQPLEDAGFRANVHLVGPEGSTILILVASR